MGFSVRRRVGVKRRIKQQLGLHAFGNPLPDKPSPKAILRQLLAGLFPRGRRYKIRRYQKEILITQVKKIYKQQYIEARRQVLIHDRVVAFLGVIQQLCNSAPVWTGTLVANFYLSLVGTATFQQFAAYYPKKIKGTELEDDARQISVDRAERKASIIFRRGVSSKKAAGRDIYIVNPTPYMDYTDFGAANEMDRIVESSMNYAEREIARNAPNDISRLMEHGRA